VQIPTNKITQKSPFELKADVAQVIAEADVESEAERAERLAREAAERVAAERKIEIQTELGKLKLFAVVGGRNPAARINMSVVRQGDVLVDLFTVVEIQARAVIVECDGEQYTLNIAGKSNGS
jgi:hypothetical protein